MIAIFRKCIYAVILVQLMAISTHAQSADTLVIKNTGIDAMANAIMGDTTKTGERLNPNRVYALVRGERYINSISVVNKGYPLQIVGQASPTTGNDPGPAIIQHTPDSTGHYDADRILDLHGDLIMKNTWILSWIPTGAQLWEPVLEEADSAHLRIDHCIFEWSQGPAVHIASKWTTTYFTNCLFRNANYTNEWWAGRVIYYTAPADTLVEINNTVENVGFGLLQSQGIGLNYFFCDHNTIVNCAKFCLLESYYTNAYIANNLFVNCHFAAERMQDRPRQDPDLLLYGQTINLDTLMVGGKTLGPTDPKELNRVVVYANNAAFFDTTDFYPFYRLYNDTASALSGAIVPEPVMNGRTRSMFSWHPHMKNVGSIDRQDPEFVNPPQNMSMILAFLTDRYSPTPKNNILWGYDPDSLNDPSANQSARNLTLSYSNSSKGFYPTPEDFSYTNLVLLKAGTGEVPVGDLNWFPENLSNWSAGNDKSALEKIGLQPGH